jgi:GntR family transcriptional regulator
VVDIDHASPVPLYHQVYHAILDAIREGRFVAGEPLPSEAELCERFDVSRITVRQALRDLVRDRHLVRPRPRARLIPRAMPIEQRLLRLSSFLIADALDQGHSPRFELRGAERVDQEAMVTPLLRSYGPSFFRIDRLLVDQREPLARMTSFVPEHRCPGMLDRLSGGGVQSLQRLIEDNYGHTFARAEQWLSARQASPLEADALEIPAQAPVIVIRRLTQATDGEPIEYFECVFRADRYEFAMTVAEEPEEE